MAELTEPEYHAVLKNDFPTFLERSFIELHPYSAFMQNWHFELIADRLERCRAGELKRLIINLPPRSGKSFIASVAFPAWLLGHNPAEQIICASYSQDLAEKHALDCRMLMESNFYRSIFATRLSAEKSAVSDFLTIHRGQRLSTSRGGSLLGRGANYIIIDDILKPDESHSDAQRTGGNEWYSHTLYPRLNSKETGCIIIVMQRLHEDDLVGYVQRLESWEILSLPAIAERDEQFEIKTPLGPRALRRIIGEALHPERESVEVLAAVRANIGEYNFAGQYQQSPAPAGGGFIKAEWFKTYAERDLPESDLVFQSWDTANKVSELSDYSVCTTWGRKGKNLYLRNVFRKRLEYPDLKRAVMEQAKAFNPKSILIEDKASGTQLIQDLVADGIHAIKRYRSDLDKVMRARSVTSTIENGFVYLPESAHWLDAYLHELVTFPRGKHDDQVDSTSQALDWAKDPQPYSGWAEYLKKEAAQLQAEAEKPLQYNFKNLPDGWLGFHTIRFR